MLPRAGYTLPVFACAAAVAALRYLNGERELKSVTLDLIKPPTTAEIPIEQVAAIAPQQTLAITRSDPGDNLDLTRHTPIWAKVEYHPDAEEAISIQGGEGIGKHRDRDDAAAIYNYARQLLNYNLKPYLQSPKRIRVTLILPEGQQLAQRTSNEAFGIVEGLSLLGTSGIAEPLSAPGQLEIFQQQLTEKATQTSTVVFCLGENGLSLARQMGIGDRYLIKTANWLGSLQVAATTCNIKDILLFGYHGKLIKLAGGIFHTHHYLADGRLEILAAFCVRAGVANSLIQEVLNCPTTEAALQLLQQQNAPVAEIYRSIALTLDRRSQDYIFTQVQRQVRVGSFLFGRGRSPLAISPHGQALLDNLC